MQLGPSLERAAANAKRELLLVAPFIKVQAFEKVLERVDVESLHVVTRWKPIEILRGVIDIEVYEHVRDHGGKVSLRQDLHAKYFRADARVCRIRQPDKSRTRLVAKPTSSSRLSLIRPTLRASSSRPNWIAS